MGKRSRHRGHHYQKNTSESDSDGESRQESYFFRKYDFDTSTLRLQWGLLTLDNIRELDLSDEEFAAMMMSQLDLRDTCIDGVGGLMSELIDKGRSIEKYNSYLLQKICDLEEEYYSGRKSTGDERRSKCKESEEHIHSKADRYHSDKNRRSSSPSFTGRNVDRSSHLHASESPIHSKWKNDISETDTSGGSERDKIKDMVANVLKTEKSEGRDSSKERERIEYENSEREQIKAMVAEALKLQDKENSKESDINEFKKSEREKIKDLVAKVLGKEETKVSDEGNPEKEKIKAMVAKAFTFQYQESSKESDGNKFMNFEIGKIKDLEAKVLGNESSKNEESKIDGCVPDRDKIKAMVAKALQSQKTSTEENTEKKSGESTSESTQKDKIKAMVAMAFKAQGYGLFDDGMGSADIASKVSFSETKDSLQSGENKDVTQGWDSRTGESVADQVKAVASKAVEYSGYSYQAELGLYYDYNSGYYYNAENGLYYDPKTGTYFYYDHTSQSYQFHSQVPINNDTGSTADGTASSSTNATEQNSSNPKNAEEGDTSTWSAEALMADMENAYRSKYGSTAQIPPSLRLMVTESGVETVKVGTLHLVTIDGGRVGRSQENLVQLEDEIISRVHAEIIYKSDGPNDHHYYIKDMGSAVGTYINDTCISVPGEPSPDIEIGHGWDLKFGTIKLKCHVHPGYLSCNECEPGIVMANLPSQSGHSRKYVRNNIEKTRMKVVKAMKKKYALEYSSTVPILPGDYEDRAKKRRKKVGSDNPYEKTEVASTTTEIRDTNKGFALLKKMGWSKGEALGKSQPGITEPIEASSTVGRGGLGFVGGLPPPTSRQNKRKKILDVTRQRFNKI